MPRDATAPREIVQREADSTETTSANESGQTMAEYALITALIGLVVVGAITTVGNPAIIAFYTKLGAAIP